MNDHKEKTFLLIDMTVPSDRKISLKEYEKVSRYKDLEVEIQKMWHLKTTVLPVVIGAVGMIKRKSEDHIKKIPGNPCLQELQKIVLNGTAHFCGVYYPCDQKYCSFTIKRPTTAKCYSYKVHKPSPSLALCYGI